jgi:hypothetical protein
MDTRDHYQYVIFLTWTAVDTHCFARLHRPRTTSIWPGGRQLVLDSSEVSYPTLELVLWMAPLHILLGHGHLYYGVFPAQTDVWTFRGLRGFLRRNKYNHDRHSLAQSARHYSSLAAHHESLVTYRCL